jgi:hypothetical protein
VDVLLLREAVRIRSDHSLCLMADSMRHVNSLTHRTISMSGGCWWQSAINCVTMIDMQSELHNASFFSSISTNSKNPLTHLLSKCINVKCQIRKFSSVALDRMREPQPPKHSARNKEPTPAFTRARRNARRTVGAIRQMLLCSLLGNYPHCNPESRPPLEARRVLYDIFQDNTEQHHHWVMALIKNCDELLLNAMRDYMIYAIDCNPVLSRHLDPLMHLRKFRLIVNATMDRVRMYFHFAVQRTSCLTKSLEAAGFEQYAPEVHKQINDHIAFAHDSILRISYHKPKLQIHDLLVGERLGYPLVAVMSDSDLETPRTDADACDDDDDEDEGAGITKAIRMCQSSTTSSKRVKRTKDQSRLSILSYISPEQYKALNDVVIRERPLDAAVMSRTIPWLEHFGVSQHTIGYIEQLIQHYHNQTMNQQNIKKKLRELHRFQPHAYNLLQVICELIKEKQEHLVIHQLPADYALNQIAACQNQFADLQLHDSNSLPTCVTDFVYCRVCETVYSLLRDASSQFRRQYKHGLRDPLVDLCTFQIYCRHSKSNHRGSCERQPLVQLALLGKMVVWNGRMIMLCPQCGHPMVLDSDCAWNEKGPACCDCTRDWRNRPLMYVAVERQFEGAKACLQCNEHLENNTAYGYPHGVYMCRRHSTSAMQKAVAETSGEWHTKEELIKFMLKSIQDRKQSRHDNSLGYYKRQLARSKLTSRNKRK